LRAKAIATVTTSESSGTLAIEPVSAASPSFCIVASPA